MGDIGYSFMNWDYAAVDNHAVENFITAVAMSQHKQQDGQSYFAEWVLFPRAVTVFWECWHDFLIAT